MIKSFRIKIILFFLFLAVPLGGVFGAQDDGIFTYLFHLYFDNGALVKDRDFETPFELIAQEFQDSEVMAGSYYGEILSVTNQKLAIFPFFPPLVGGKGKTSSLAPYFDNAKTANFYNPQNQKLFTIDLAPFGPVCNEDKQCNADTGETFLNCPSDCQALVSPSAIPTPAPLVNFGMTDVLSSPLFVAIFIAITVAIIIWLWLRRKRNSSYESPSSPQV